MILFGNMSAYKTVCSSGLYTNHFPGCTQLYPNEYPEYSYERQVYISIGQLAVIFITKISMKASQVLTMMHCYGCCARVEQVLTTMQCDRCCARAQVEQVASLEPVN